MIPRFMLMDIWPSPVPVTAPPSKFWVRLKYHATGHEETYVEKTASARAILIILTSGYADVVDQGER